jgi:Predicted membrane protein (DUF2142)
MFKNAPADEQSASPALESVAVRGRQVRGCYQQPVVIVCLLVLLRFAFGINYCLAVPAWEAYDEPGHFAYAASLATHKALPQETDAVPNPERIQPPLYYLGLAAFLTVSGTDVGAFRFPATYPYFYYGTSGVNYALHPLNMSPERRQIEVALLFSRVASLLLSLLGIPFAFLAARLVWPLRPALQVAAVAIFALWPQYLFNGSMVTNDSPTPVLGALLTWLLLRFQVKRPSVRLGLICLLIIVAVTFVKLNMLMFLLPLVVVVILSASPRLIALTLGVGTAALLVTLIVLQSLPSVLLPFFQRNPQGDTVLSALWKYLTGDGRTVLIGDALGYALQSSFGLFGWGNVPLPDWIQSLWVGGAALACAGLVVAIIRKQRMIRSLVVPVSILVAMIAGGLALSLFFLTIHLIPGRYLLPALCALSLLLVMGWSGLGRPWNTLLTWGTVASLIILGVVIPRSFLPSVYSRPPVVASNGTIPNHRSVELAPGAELVGYSVPPARLYPGDDVAIEVYWTATQPIETDYTVRVEIVGPDGQGYGLLDTYPGNGIHPTSDWAVNAVFRDRYLLRIRSDYPAPGMGHFKVTLHTQGFSKSIELVQSPIVVHARLTPEPAIGEALAARFGPYVLLRAAYMQSTAPRTLSVGLLWQATGAPIQDQKVFVHVENEHGVPITQKDQLPRGGAFPLSQWLIGEFVPDQYTLVMPGDAVPGRYMIKIGFYDPETMLRWPVQNGTAPDSLVIGLVWLDEGGNLRVEQQYVGRKF